MKVKFTANISVKFAAAILMMVCCVGCTAESKSISAEPEIAAEQQKAVEIDGENLYDTFAELWFNANSIYNVEGFDLFECGETYDMGDGPVFYEITNYDEVVPTVFSANGITQLERAMMGDITVINKKDGKVYRPAGNKTTYCYENELEDIRIKQAADNKLVLEMQYRDNPGYVVPPDDTSYVPEYVWIDFTVVRENGKWLVEDYLFPEFNYNAE